MLPPRKWNPSENASVEPSMRGTMDNNHTHLEERIAELEARNLYLQTLVVELLDKNEQLRRQNANQQNANQ